MTLMQLILADLIRVNPFNPRHPRAIFLSQQDLFATSAPSLRALRLIFFELEKQPTFISFFLFNPKLL
jgi:hypothetical protein